MKVVNSLRFLSIDMSSFGTFVPYYSASAGGLTAFTTGIGVVYCF